MKIAVLIQCHKNAEQVNMLISALDHDCIDVYVHVDRKSNIVNDINSSNKIFILPEEKRISVEWAKFSQVEASLNLLLYALSHDSYDYYWLISGQDFPLVSADRIVDFFSLNPDCNFVDITTSLNSGLGKSNNLDKRNAIYYPEWILNKGIVFRIIKRAWVELTGGYNRTFKLFRRNNTLDYPFFFGSQWWCICGKFAHYVMDYTNSHPEYQRYYINCNCSDESFFQTLLMNSIYKDFRRDYLLYVDWSEGNNSPKTLTVKDYDRVISSGKLIARKFDISIDRNIVDMIRERM